MKDKDVLIEELCRHYDVIGDFIEYRGVDEGDVEDLLNDVFIDAFNAINKGSGPEKKMMLAWLRSIADNKRNAYFKKKYKNKEISRKAENELSDMEYLENMVDDTSVESVLIRAEETDLLELLLTTLPETANKVVTMHTWGNRTFTEIAELMGINVNTIKSLYYRSCALMKKNYFKITGEEEYYGR